MPAPRVVGAVLACCVVSACAGGQTPAPVGPPEQKELTESQALQVIQETLQAAGAPVSREWSVFTDDGHELVTDVRVRVGSPAYAIEWVSDLDRQKYETALPAPSADDPLHIITALAADQTPAQVLVLDASTYRYEGNPGLVNRGAPSLEDAETRVRRDVTDFLAYVRGQGGW